MAVSSTLFKLIRATASPSDHSDPFTPSIHTHFKRTNHNTTCISKDYFITKDYLLQHFFIQIRLSFARHSLITARPCENRRVMQGWKIMCWPSAICLFLLEPLWSHAEEARTQPSLGDCCSTTLSFKKHCSAIN